MASAMRNYFPLRDSQIVYTAAGALQQHRNTNELDRNGLSGVRILPSLRRAHVAAHNEGPVPMVYPASRIQRPAARAPLPNIRSAAPPVGPQGFPVLRNLGVPAPGPLISRNVLGAARNGINPARPISLLNNNAARQLNVQAPVPTERHLPAYVQDRRSRQIPAAPRRPSQADIVRAMAARSNAAVPGDDAYVDIPHGPIPPAPQVM